VRSAAVFAAVVALAFAVALPGVPRLPKAGLLISLLLMFLPLPLSLPRAFAVAVAASVVVASSLAFEFAPSF
jgi:hypothetical protein